MATGASPSPAIRVVIPAQRAGALLARQLDALVEQDNAPEFAVVVVLDLDDPGATLVASYQDRLSITSVERPMRGAAAARNVGAASCTGAILLFCDADDVVGPGWVRLMSVQVQQSGVAGSPMRVEWQLCPRWARPYYEEMDRSSLHLFYGVAPFVVSASLGIDRSLFEAAGGFDESFLGAGGEEVDLCIRLLQLSENGNDDVRRSVEYGLVHDDSAIVRYRPRSTFRSIARQRAGYSRGAARVILKHQLTGIGTVASTDIDLLRSTLRSPRRIAVTAWSFLALRRGFRQGRKERVGINERGS
ncbi:MAG: glycosyltransferase [Actinomycetes bacterium]